MLDEGSIGQYSTLASFAVTEREALGEALSTIEDFGQFRILFRSWIGVDRVLRFKLDFAGAARPAIRRTEQVPKDVELSVGILDRRDGTDLVYVILIRLETLRSLVEIERSSRDDFQLCGERSRK